MTQEVFALSPLRHSQAKTVSSSSAAKDLGRSDAFAPPRFSRHCERQRSNLCTNEYPFPSLRAIAKQSLRLFLCPQPRSEAPNATSHRRVFWSAAIESLRLSLYFRLLDCFVALLLAMTQEVFALSPLRHSQAKTVSSSSAAKDLGRSDAFAPPRFPPSLRAIAKQSPHKTHTPVYKILSFRLTPHSRMTPMVASFPFMSFWSAAIESLH